MLKSIMGKFSNIIDTGLSLASLTLETPSDQNHLAIKKGNRDRVVSELLDSSLVEKVHEQVKTKRYAATDGNFLSHAHYRDPYFDFRE